MKRTFTVVMLPDNHLTVFSAWDFEVCKTMHDLERKYGEAEMLSHIPTDHAPELTTKLWHQYKKYHVAKAIFKVKDATEFLATVEAYRGTTKLALGEKYE